jgi:hypothetical protein
LSRKLSLKSDITGRECKRSSLSKLAPHKAKIDDPTDPSGILKGTVIEIIDLIHTWNLRRGTNEEAMAFQHI